MRPLRWEACEVVVPDASEPGRSSLKLEARRARVTAACAAAVVASPHPLYGGTLHNPVVLGIAEGLAQAGVEPIAFNWRGVDGSRGTLSDSLEAAVADFRGALAALGSVARVYAAGYSFGAAVALLAAREDARIAGVIMVAPPVGMLRREDLGATSARLAVVVGDDDEYAPLAELRTTLAARSDATLDVIEGADHFFHFGGLHEIPDRVSSALSSWLHA